MTDGQTAGGRLWTAVVAAAFVAVLGALAGLPAHATHGARTTADEPQYLLSAISLAEDGDLNIADELATERWRAFHQAQLPQQTRPLPGGVRISPHDPLLPVLIAPGVALAGWAGAKATLALLAGVLAGLLVWTAVARLGVPAATAGLVVGVFAASVPLAPYGTQIYPELPAALAVAAGLAALLRPTLRTVEIAIVVAVCIALPWLGIKYAPVAAVLVVALVLRAVHAGLGRAAAMALLLLAVAGVAYLLVHRAVWTGWTVYASADHFVESGEVGVVGFDPDYWARTTRLVGLLVERSFGIAAWQPAWLLLVPAVAAACRGLVAGALAARRRAARASAGSVSADAAASAIRTLPGGGVLLAVLTAGWLVASYVALTMAGWWFPGRQIVVVLPAGVLAIAWWVDRSRRRRLALAGLGAIGVASWLALVYEAAVGRLTLVVDFYATVNPWYRLWRLALPDYLAPSVATWVRHGLWLAAIAALASYGWRSVGASEDGRLTGDDRSPTLDTEGQPLRVR